jgi:hypothetical protein
LAGLSPGTYWLALGLYDAQQGDRLPVTHPRPAEAPAYGDNALLIGPVVVTANDQ